MRAISTADCQEVMTSVFRLTDAQIKAAAALHGRLACSTSPPEITARRVVEMIIDAQGGFAFGKVVQPVLGGVASWACTLGYESDVVTALLDITNHAVLATVAHSSLSEVDHDILTAPLRLVTSGSSWFYDGAWVNLFVEALPNLGFEESCRAVDALVRG